jgi:RNA methyltransferase, TrmH family
MLTRSQIKSLQQLHLKKYRDARRLFIAEGVKMVNELVDHFPEGITALYANDEYLSRHAKLLKKGAIHAIAVTDVELKQISMQATPNQVLAVCRYLDSRSGGPADENFTFYLDDIRDPGNMGTILRVGEWFGVKTIYCSPGSCDLYNPKVLQASMGSFLRINLVYVLLSELLSKNKFERVYGAVLGGTSLYADKLMPGLIVIGNEANGIHARNLPLITNPLTIPASAQSGAESLNAAMAAAIIASEFFRQRQAV